MPKVKAVTLWAGIRDGQIAMINTTSDNFMAEMPELYPDRRSARAEHGKVIQVAITPIARRKK